MNIEIMPQSRLPDVNTAIIQYRREAKNSIKSKNYTACIGALYALNGCLPEKYRVIISTIDYEEKLKQQNILVFCSHCNQKTDLKALEIKRILLTSIEGLITGLQYEKVWQCPKADCGKLNKLLKTRMTQEIIKEPSYLQVVPKPPQRKEGILDHSSFHIKFSTWANTLLAELEAQFAKFRDDNWHKGDEMIEADLDVDTTNEDYD